MKCELLTITSNAEELIERATRICYNSMSNKETRASFLQSVIKRGHEGILEHASVTFLVEGISRALSHQLVRHRIASYLQRSQRYVKEGNFEYIEPESIKASKVSHDRFINAIKIINSTYNNLLYDGVPPEDARFILPNACETKIVITMNFRSLRNFFKLRLDRHAQWEIRELAKHMFRIVYEHAPSLFEDFLILAGETEKIKFKETLDAIGNSSDIESL